MFDQIKGGLAFYAKAKTKFKIPSKTAAEFIQYVLDDDRVFYAYHPIEVHRENLLRRNEVIEVKDFGAGSRKLHANQRKVSDIAKYALSSVEQCRRLFKLVEHYKPKYVLELGTSFGISTAYLAKANSNTSIYTLEGDPETANLAEETFRLLSLDNIKLVVGRFADTLPSVLKEMVQIDMAFIDGHHTYEATLAYTQQILPLIHEKTILVFDDIYWSKGMQKAWSDLKKLPGVTLALETFDQGFLFFDKSITPSQSFAFIDFKYKPWQLGLFQ